MIELLIVVGIVLFIAASVYSSGKRTGSRKGYGVGREHGRRWKR